MSDTTSISTKDKILEKATELFAERGFDAVSIRDITRAIGLNEASLYNHYKSKANLFEIVLKRLDDTLINPGFSPIPLEYFENEKNFDLADFLIIGAKHFFSKADKRTLLTWRILMISQYKFEAAKDSVQNHIINAPTHFFTSILENLCKLGKINKDVDCNVYGRIIAAVFFDFSFRSNLKVSWDDNEDEDFIELTKELKCIARGIEVKD